MPASRLGPLAVESKLGDHPSQSAVWRAIHVQLQRALAVKIFTVPFGGTPEARAEFASEWERLKTISHPAIVRCYGGGLEGSDGYLASELIDGETLSAQLERRGRLSWETVLDLAEPLADAIDYLHSRELVHGRIQPDKIMISGLSPVLIDVRCGDPTTPFRTGRPSSAAEMSLRAPESIANSDRRRGRGTPREDLYGFGATLYLALTGRPPIDGATVAEVTTNAPHQVPASPASIAMDVPIWLDKLLMRLLEKDPRRRPPGAAAVKLALAEVRKRAMSRTGVAEHASAGFSPLAVTNQKQTDEARALLGRELVGLDEEEQQDPAEWYEKAWFLVPVLLLILGLIGYLAWPLSEAGLRRHAEELLAQETRSAMIQAKLSYLEPLLKKYPTGEHALWAAEQIDRVEMVEAEHVLSVKLKRNLPLKNEGERLYAEAMRFERFGDTATALDRYRGIVTLLGDDNQYRPYVNLALRQVGRIEAAGPKPDEAARIIQAKLSEADQAYTAGNVVAARRIWYSIVDLYASNLKVAPLVAEAQDRLAANATNRAASANP